MREEGWNEGGWNEGRIEGRTEGRTEGWNACYNAGLLPYTISLVRKKYHIGKSLETIAAELESDVDTIKPIYEMIAEYPQASDRQILERLSPEIACTED